MFDSKFRDEIAGKIDDYAWAHAGAAFVCGQFGGQFGFDTVVLTGLTVAMINDICDTCGIRNFAGRGVHIGSAISRLTVRGTVIARLILNWIPVAGPLANAITTFFLTKGAGKDCFRDIEKNIMSLEGQAKKEALRAVKRGVISFSVDHVSDAIDSIEDLDHLTKSEAAAKLEKAGSAVSENFPKKTVQAMLPFTQLAQDETLNSIEKSFVYVVISNMTNAAMSKQKLSVRSILEESLLSSIVVLLTQQDAARHGEVPVIDGLDLKKHKFLAHITSIEEEREQIRLLRDKLPERFSGLLNMSLDQYEGCIGEREKRKAITEIAKRAAQGYRAVLEATA